MKSHNIHNYAVIVAGGSGTRLWPVSRQELPKQMQKLIGDKSLIEDTVDRISKVVPLKNIFISTSSNYSDRMKKILPNIPSDNIIIEPVARGTTAAFALFTESIYQYDPEATIFSLASDHAVSDNEIFESAIINTFNFVNANPQSIGLLGIKPTKADPGLGYIKTDKIIQKDPLVYSVEKFIEKPSAKIAEVYVQSDGYYWNAAYYCFKAKTLLDAYEEADQEIVNNIRSYVKSRNIDDFNNVPIKPHEIELINASRFPLVLVPSNFKWSDVGNWSSLHDLLTEAEDENNMVIKTDQHVNVNSTDCMVVVEGSKKLVATVGLNNIVIVDTPDALLVMDKSHNQNIKTVLADIKQRGLAEYL